MGVDTGRAQRLEGLKGGCLTTPERLLTKGRIYVHCDWKGEEIQNKNQTVLSLGGSVSCKKGKKKKWNNYFATGSHVAGDEDPPG